MDINLTVADFEIIKKNRDMAKALKIEFMPLHIENIPWMDTWTIYEIWLLKYLVSDNIELYNIDLKLSKWQWVPRIRTIIGNVDHSRRVLFPTLSYVFAKANKPLIYTYVGPQLDLDKASAWVYNSCNPVEYAKILPYLSDSEIEAVNVLNEEYKLDCGTYTITPVKLDFLIYPTDTVTLKDINDAIKYNYQFLDTNDPIIFDIILKVIQDLITKGTALIAVNSPISSTDAPVTPDSLNEFNNLKNAVDTPIDILPEDKSNKNLFIIIIVICLVFIATKFKSRKKLKIRYPQNSKVSQLINLDVPNHKIKNII